MDTSTQHILKYALKSMQSASDIETLLMHLLIQFALFIFKSWEMASIVYNNVQYKSVR